MKKRTGIVLLQLCILILSLFSTIIVAGADWPMLNHDPEHTSFSRSTAPDTMRVMWTFDTGSFIASSPAVVGDRLYIGADNHQVYCLNATTGEKIWNYTTGGRVRSSPAVVDGKVYVAADNNWLYCLDAVGNGNGNTSRHWFFNGAEPSTSPVVVDGYVYFSGKIGTKGYIYCLDASNGLPGWQRLLNKVTYSSPAVADGKVYACSSSDNRVYCLNASTGQIQWNYSMSGYGYILSSPTVSNGKVFIGSADHCVYCLDAMGNNNGSTNLLWTFTTYGRIKNSIAAIANNKVYIGSEDSTLYCLNADGTNEETTTQLWNFTTGGQIDVSPAVADGKVYVGSWDHKLYCFDALTGQQLSSYTTGEAIDASPAVANGKIYIASHDHQVYCFSQDLPPSTPEQPFGVSTGTVNTLYAFSTHAIDPDGDQLWYQWNWGTKVSDWIGPVASGADAIQSYLWTSPGTYDVIVKAKDQYGKESDWSLAQSVTITSEPASGVLNVVVSPSTVPEGDSFVVTVTMAAVPQKDVTVTFLGETQTTDIFGNVTLIAPSVAQNIQYIITARETSEAMGSAVVTVLDISQTFTGFVYGTVTDETGLPLGDVQISVFSGTERGLTTSDNTGRYVVAVSEGTYTVIASKPQYQTATTTNIEIYSQLATELNIVLQQETPSQESSGDKWLLEYTLDQKTTDGSIGARVNIRQGETPIVYSYITDLTIHAQVVGETVSMTVSAPSDTGATIIVVQITGVFPDLTHLVVTVDNTTINQASGPDDFFNLEGTTEPTWLQYIFKNDTYALVKFHGFSDHTVSISSFLETFGGLTALPLYGIICALVCLVFASPIIIRFVKKVYFQKEK